MMKPIRNKEVALDFLASLRNSNIAEAILNANRDSKNVSMG